MVLRLSEQVALKNAESEIGELEHPLSVYGCNDDEDNYLRQNRRLR